jgi:UDP-N-acetylglucosamine:LPS N-acetylglucosamine transferase
MSSWSTGSKRSSVKHLRKIIFYDYASNVDELMEVSTLIVSKPGGMTTSECLAKGLPMVIIDPIPGQEERNSQFLVNQGMAIRVDDKRHIARDIDLLLNNPKKLAAMKASSFKERQANGGAGYCAVNFKWTDLTIYEQLLSFRLGQFLARVLPSRVSVCAGHVFV